MTEVETSCERRTAEKSGHTVAPEAGPRPSDCDTGDSLGTPSCDGLRTRVQVPPEKYTQPGYNTKQRFCSYWHQIDEVIRTQPTEVLEIGPGSQFVAGYLKSQGLSVTTVDIDPELGVDVVATVTNLPFAANSFDTVLCCEVLEHIPFLQAESALGEIHQVAKRHAVISLPDSTPYARVLLKLPRVLKVQWGVSLPKLSKRHHEFDGEHYWEIGKNGCSFRRRRLASEVRKAGFCIVSSYRVFEFPYFRFFILKK